MGKISAIDEVTQRPENRTCADCGAKAPRWASVNLGVLICIDCSSAHRNLGTHISVVKSFTLDKWPDKWVELMGKIGNRIANEYYEHVMGAGDKLTQDATLEKRATWIRQKYEGKEWCPPGKPSPSELLAEGRNPDAYGSGGQEGASRGGGGAAEEKSKAKKKEKSEKSEKKEKKHKKDREDAHSAPPALDRAAQKLDQAFAPLGAWAADVGEQEGKAAGKHRERRSKSQKHHKHRKHDKGDKGDADGGWASPGPCASAPPFGGFAGVDSGWPNEGLGQQQNGFSAEAGMAGGVPGTEGPAERQERKAALAAVARLFSMPGSLGVPAAALLPLFGFDLQEAEFHPTALKKRKDEGQLLEERAARARARAASPQDKPFGLGAFGGTFKFEAGGEGDGDVPWGLAALDDGFAGVPDVNLTASITDKSALRGRFDEDKRMWFEDEPDADSIEPLPSSIKAAFSTEFSTLQRELQRLRDEMSLLRKDYKQLHEAGLTPPRSAAGSPGACGGRDTLGQDLAGAGRRRPAAQDPAWAATPPPAGAVSSSAPPPEGLEQTMSVLSPGYQSWGSSPHGAAYSPEAAGRGSRWGVDADAFQGYLQLFCQADGNSDGYVEGAEARELFDRSQLDPADLGLIWALCDINRDGRLTLTEFVCAAHLVTLRRHGGEVPPSLPPELWSAASSLAAPHGGEGLGSPWEVGPLELEGYCGTFARLNPGTGHVGAAEAKEVLEATGLPVTELSRIWAMSDVDGDGSLTLGEFVCAMHLATRRVGGLEIPDALPAELVAACTSVDLGGAPEAEAFDWSVALEELAGYRAIFESACGGGRALTADEAQEVLQRSQLPPAELSQIWMLSDLDGDGQLAFGEFVCAMHLVSLHRHGASLPAALPPELRFWASGQDDGRLSSPWAVGPAELRQYAEVFERLPRSVPELLGPDEAKEVLERSGLQVAELSHIWQLADADEDGQLSFAEFACAMHLAARRREGLELPTALPRELAATCAVPPLPPAGANEGSPWVVDAEQLEAYRGVFESVDRRSPGHLGPDEARAFLDRSGLPPEDLTRIWQLSDADGDGVLIFGEFACAVHLVSLRLQGRELPSGVPPELAASLAPPADGLWAATAAQVESYRALFRQAEREDPLFLGPSEAREALERSGLPHPELSHIWGLADADGDGQLSFGEFACAMHLTGGRLAGLALPPELPPELRPLLDAPAEVAASAPVVAANAKAEAMISKLRERHEVLLRQ